MSTFQAHITHTCGQIVPGIDRIREFQAEVEFVDGKAEVECVCGAAAEIDQIDETHFVNDFIVIVDYEL